MRRKSGDSRTGDAPPEPREPSWWQNIQVVGGLTAVSLGLFVVLFIATLSIGVIHDDPDKVATIASAAFTVVGTLVGAYFGVKVGTDQTKTAMQQTDRAHVAARQEAAKAQAFAAHVASGGKPEEVLRLAQEFALGQVSAETPGEETPGEETPGEPA
jgi:hypothetical protein